jgi:hypothetical protein
MASLPDVRFGVIDDARRRQRRRWIGWIAVSLVALVALVLALDRPAPDRPSAPVRPVQFVPAGRLLSREPYMGIACNTPNSTACDLVGLGVWLKRPALAVTAEIRGRRFSLSDRSLSTPIRNHRRMDFAGYLHGAGLRRTYHLPKYWIGAKPSVHQLVRLRIDYGNGPLVETHVRVWLMGGWG